MLKLSIQVLGTILMVAVVTRADENSTLTAYVQRNNEHYFEVFEFYNSELTNLASSFGHRTHLLNYLSEIVADKLNEAHDIVETYEVLNQKTSTCLSTHQKAVPQHEKLIQAMTECVSTCMSDLKNMLQLPKTTQLSLENFYNGNLQTSMHECDTKFQNTTVEYSSCITEAINVLNTFIINNKRIFATQIKQVHFSAEHRLREAMECGLEVIYDSAYSYGQINSFVTACSKGENVEGDDGDDDDYTDIKLDNFCDTVIQLGSKDLENQNPLLDIDDNTNCVLFQFT